MLLRWFEHSQVYCPDRRMEATGAEIGRSFEDVFFRTSDGVQLNAWYYPAPQNSRHAAFAVLVCHGNAGNIGYRLDFYRMLLDSGVNVFAFDYRGYGRSEGKPTETGTYLDGEAAYAWLRQKGFAPDRIIVWGESLGGGIASELSLRQKTAALVLQSTFTNIPDIGSEIFPYLPVRWIGKIKYDTWSKLPRIRVPVLILHSRQDKLARFQHAEKNFAAANEPKSFCELRGDHNEPVWEQPEFRTAVENFLGQLEKNVNRS
jgi:fermentation-respiration switch protein FrsA (DUF1100 family)